MKSMEELENTDILAVFATLLLLYSQPWKFSCALLTCKICSKKMNEEFVHTVQNVRTCPDYEHIAEQAGEWKMHLKTKVTVPSANIKFQLKEM